MSRMLKASSFAAFAAAVVLVLGAARSASAEDAAKAKAKGSIKGTVTGTDGKPAVGVTVRLTAAAPAKAGKGKAEKAAPAAALPADGEGQVRVLAADKPEKGEGKGKRSEALKEATTSEKGEFTFTEVPAGDYAVVANLKGVGSGRGKVSVKAGEAATVSLSLKAREKGAKGDKPAK